MKPKTVKIIYWITTVEGVVSLGYPVYFLMILGVAKVLGSVAIVQNKYKTIKEWAYAGFAIDIISASASLAYSGMGVAFALFPLIFLVLMFISYISWKKIYY